MLTKLPKIELHCHLDGSVRPETIIEIAKKENIKLESFDVNYIKNKVIAPVECTSLNEYLERFNIPNLVMQSKESLERIAFELMEDAAKENVKYIEIRFAPLLHTIKGLTIEEVIESVLNGIKKGEDKYEIKGNLILGCLRHLDVNTVFEVIEKGKKYLNNGVVAIDLCGPEEEGFCERFEEPIALARQYGYRVTIHAGETGFGKNVLDAINILGAERIGHGVFIRNDESAYKIVKDKKIALEMCPTSNVQTKAVNSYENHPFYDFYKDGIKVTINTDNRTVSDINLTSECDVIFNNLGVTKDEYREIYLDSIEATFANDSTKKWLKQFI